jgi:peptidoglycan/LPS O-acetylase OafA/YrhL
MGGKQTSAILLMSIESKAGMQILDKTRSIPSLDGMRAISILLVILSHSTQYLPRWMTFPIPFLLFAHTGVMVFFVLSGFLITSLLLKELHATGTIGLKRFYLRRAFRIFPPFYLYLAVIVCLTLSGVLNTPLRAILFSAIYGTNYYLGPGAGSSALQHIWSLSVEEQFYILWPATLLLLGKRRSTILAIVLIVISPLSRVVTYFVLAQVHRAMVARMFHSSVDTIMFGCLLALLWQNDRFNRLLRIWLGPWSMAGAILFLFILDPVLERSFHGDYDLIIGMTLEGISICLVMIYVVRRPETLPGRILNTRVLRHIGVISYGLYIWQGIFTAEGGRFFPFNMVSILLCAELSYWAVERPSLRLRDRILKRASSESLSRT